MKKSILSLVFIFIVSLSIHAQGLYLGAGFGYGFRAGGTVVGSNSNSNGSYEVVKGSYGAGMVPNVSVGYFFSENLGAELNLGYLIGRKTTLTDNLGNNTGTDKFNSTTFYLNPSFVICGNNEAKVVPYAKIGMFLGMGTKATIKSHTDYFNNAQELTATDDDEFEYKGNMALGLTSALGMDFMLTEKFAIFGELTTRLASWSPKSYTASTTSIDYINGIPQPSSQFSVSGNFVKEIPANYTGTNTGAEVLALSAVGLNVGVKFYLNK